MTRDLARLFRPRSIAVFGGGWAANAVEQCLKMGFEGDIWPVHPSRSDVHGRRCFRGVADLPDAPDAAFVAVNRRLAVEVVGELAARGAGGAVCFASGFAEAEDGRAEGAALQARLVAAAGAMPLLGPNCYGLINYLDGALLWPDQHGGRREDRGVAILTQSSNILINMTMQRRGLPLAYCIAAGNQAQTGLAEMATACLDDPRVTVAGLHIEGIGDLRAFEAMARRARGLGKPVVALKIGRSEEARSGTLSHTASMAGSDAASRAFLARLGIPVLRNIPEFLEAMKLLHVLGPAGGRAVASISCSGGEASIAADAAVGRAVRFRPLSEAEKRPIAEVLGPLVTVTNPLDYHTFIWGDEARSTAAFTAMLAAGFDLATFILDFPRLDRCSDAAWEPTVRSILAAQRATGARVAVTASMGENLPEARAGAFAAAGIAPMIGIDETLAAAEAAAEIGEARARPDAPPVLTGACPADGAMIDEAAAKLALAAHGLDIPRGVVAASPEEAAGAALNYPVALKGLGIAHKTEAGAVRLGLGSSGAVLEAARAMPAPGGWLVEEMVADAVAELIVGVVCDPVYGFTLTLGAGGILAELLADSATLLVPASGAEIRAALDGLRIGPVLRGHRGRPAADIEATVAAVMAVQAYAAAEADRLMELDVNPLIVTPTRAVAADALIRLGT